MLNKFDRTKMEKSNSNPELCMDHRNQKDGRSHDRETVNENYSKNGFRSAKDMSQTVCLFRKYLIERAQHKIGKTNMDESEVINKSPYHNLLPPKFRRNILTRPQSLLERTLFPELRCDAGESIQSNADKASRKQLTIFYAGGVNVYDNISAEKAQEVMLILAGESSSPKPVCKEAPKTVVRSPPHKSNLQLVHSKSKLGVPLARNYSIQCFLEKRRDRIISTSPYGAVASSPSNGADKEIERESEITENRCPSLSPFPSRLGCFFPVSAKKGCC